MKLTVGWVVGPGYAVVLLLKLARVRSKDGSVVWFGVCREWPVPLLWLPRISMMLNITERQAVTMRRV